MVAPTADFSTYKQTQNARIGTGARLISPRVPDVFIPLNAVAVGAEAALWTPDVTRSLRLMGGCISYGTAVGPVQLRINSAGAAIAFLPNAPLNTPFSFDFGLLGLATNFVGIPITALGVATQTISGTIWGIEELIGQ